MHASVCVCGGGGEGGRGGRVDVVELAVLQFHATISIPEGPTQILFALTSLRE